MQLPGRAAGPALPRLGHPGLGARRRADGHRIAPPARGRRPRATSSSSCASSSRARSSRRPRARGSRRATACRRSWPRETSPPSSPSATSARSTTRRTTSLRTLADLLLLALGPALALVAPRLAASSAASRGPTTTASTSRSRRPTRSPRSSRRSSARAPTAGLARVHGDALRPDPARLLHVEAGDDRADDRGAGSTPSRSPTSSSRTGKEIELDRVRAARRRGLRRRPRRRPRAPLEHARPDQGRPDRERQALHGVQAARSPTAINGAAAGTAPRRRCSSLWGLVVARRRGGRAAVPRNRRLPRGSRRAGPTSS